MNSLSLVGRVGADAQVRFSQGGDSVAGFSVAVDSGYGDKKQTLWFDCSVWGERAKKLAPHIKKGDRIGVVGELSTREHNGKTYLGVRVGEVSLMGNKREAAVP